MRTCATVKKLLDQAVYAPADILVAKVNVRKGQNVKKGQTLAVLDMDSLKDKIRTLSDDIEILQLQNDALLSAEAKKNSDRNQAVARAKEDYSCSISMSSESVRILSFRLSMSSTASVCPFFTFCPLRTFTFATRISAGAYTA